MTDCNSWVEMNMSAKRPKNRAMMAVMAALKRGSEKKRRSSIGSLARISHAMKATIANTATTKAAMVGGLDQPWPGPSVIAYSNELSPATDSTAPTGSTPTALGDRDSGMLSRPAAMAVITTGTLTRNTEPQ